MRLGASHSALGITEGIHWHINPDIIIDIVPDADDEQVERVKGTWKNIPGLKARVAVLTGEYTARPGPSFVRVVKDIRKEIETWQRSFQ